MTQYGGQWKEKVKKMSDRQVIAVHARIQSKERQRKNSFKENPR